jgi:hypothetical protein
MNDIHFHPMFHRFIMEKRNHFYLVLLQENNPFFYCLDQIWVDLLVSSQISTGGSKEVGGECRGRQRQMHCPQNQVY